MLYAAYGSNTNLEQMKYRCPKSKVVGKGMLKGWELVFNIHADIIETGGESEVPVLLWEIHDDEWDNLDRYEGYPRYYTRMEVMVKVEYSASEKAVVYVMTNNRKGICPPDKAYFKTCETGFTENGMDTDVLYRALEYSERNITEFNQYNPGK